VADSSPPNGLLDRAVYAVKRAVASVLSSLRRVAGSVFQIVFHDQIGDLRRQTQRLGSASVESTTYLGGEVRALDERLQAIERELAALRELLEREGPAARAEDPDEIAARPQAG
jgi:hypothetical protein